jgi:formate dehydrogenase subunit delta
MNIDLLIKMANEIGDFFAGESPPGQAPRDVANHLRRYWEPRMRREIVAHYGRGAAGLSDIARDAVGLLAAEAPAQRTPSP